MTNQASKQLRSEHPRPQFIRKDWVNLNGEWEFEYDDSQVSDQEQWHSSERVFSRRIQVPFAFQSKLSGIGDLEFMIQSGTATISPFRFRLRVSVFYPTSAQSITVRPCG